MLCIITKIIVRKISIKIIMCKHLIYTSNTSFDRIVSFDVFVLSIIEYCNTSLAQLFKSSIIMYLFYQINDYFAKFVSKVKFPIIIHKIPISIGIIPVSIGIVPISIGIIPSLIGIIPIETGNPPFVQKTIPIRIRRAFNGLGSYSALKGVTPVLIETIPIEMGMIPIQAGMIPIQTGMIPIEAGNTSILSGIVSSLIGIVHKRREVYIT